MIVCSSRVFFRQVITSNSKESSLLNYISNNQRIPRPLQFTNSYVHRSLTNQFQGYQCYVRLSYISKQSTSKGVFFPMGGNRKRRPVNPVWRPISTQSTSNEDFSTEKFMAEPDNIASIEHGDVAEGAQISHGSTSGSGLMDAEDVLGNRMTASASHDKFGDADTKNVSTTHKDKLAVSVEIGASVMRFIVGKDNSVQKEIEEEMGVKLVFPSSTKEDSIVIEGESLDAITKASGKIQAIIDEAVKSPSLNYSHFISLPLATHSELVDKLTRFQSIVLGDCDPKDAYGTTGVDSNDEISNHKDSSEISEKIQDGAVKLKVDDTNDVEVDIKNIPLVSYAPSTKPPTISDLGIDKSIFIKPKTFHLTVLMLKLWNKGRVHAAKEVLQSVYPELMEVLDNRPLFIRLKGLDCMRGSRAKAQVLYAPVEEIGDEGRLLRACQIIIDAYVKAGLVLEKDARQKLKLHATVMNTSHRKGGKSKRWKDTFDARGIFEQFGSEQWGDYHIREAHLSQRFFYDENGYYHCCASIPFPEISVIPESGVTQVESVEMSIAESV